MKKLWEDVSEVWMDGVSYLFGDLLISFYVFFTVVFTEIAYLWTNFGKMEINTIVIFTAILLGYISNVTILSFFKGINMGTRKEVTASIIYVIIFVVLFIIGCFFDFGLSFILTLIPFTITALWIWIREFQACDYIGNYSKIVLFINKLFRNKVVWLTSQIIVVGLPFVMFVFFLIKVPTLHFVVKLIIAVLYFFFIPFIAYYEDDSATCNIFELAYDHSFLDE